MVELTHGVKALLVLQNNKMPLAKFIQEPQKLIYLIWVLLFLSGFTSLVYQVIWMRELALLFSSSAQATAGTLAVFFGGLAIGGAIWSHRAPRSAMPLREYGFLEIGIGLSGILFFGLMPLYGQFYSPLYENLGSTPALLILAKLLLAALILLPPAILMGGTLPLICQQVVSGGKKLGQTGSITYGVNTLGAACGALAAGFWLPRWLGFQNTYLLAIGVSVAIGVIACLISKYMLATQNPDDNDVIDKASTCQPKSTEAIFNPKLISIAFASGALVLALEVLWTRMFQQVLQNSVYTFAVILVIFLAALATGALIASKLVSIKIKPEKMLALLLAISALASLVTPFIFYYATDGMNYLGMGEAWNSYLISIFSTAIAVLFLPGVAIGSIFPFLFRIAEKAGAPGQIVGRLLALNTAGAICGSLIAGFVLLGSIGLWNSMLIVSLAYLLLAAWVAASLRIYLTATASLVVAILFFNSVALPGVRLNANEELLGHWEGPDGYVAVIERDGSKRIKINNFYALGSSAAMDHEQNQSLIPLMPHSSPEKLLYLGMGTGISAGGGLLLPSQLVRVTELVPEVITAAKSFFNQEAMGLFTNPRAEVLARDGRNELLGRDEFYDAIIADLFVPWRAGVANLYSRDHYQVAKNRLRPNGIYVQWIPLYQVTESEFWILTRTFLEVFPQVQVWRGDFYSEQPILALVGSVDAGPIQLEDMIRNGQFLSGNPDLNPVTFLAVNLPFYAGNLGESREIVPPGPIHTDDYPIIEYQAPISHRNARAGQSQWFTGPNLIEFYEQLLAATPLNEDPYLSELDPRAQDFVSAGLSYNKGAVLHSLGQREEADRYLQEFVEQLPVNIAFDTNSQGSAGVEE